LLIIFLVAFTVAAAACSKGGESVGGDAIAVVSIAIDETTVPYSAYKGELDLSKIVLLVTWSDGEVEPIAVRDTMLTVASRTLLNTVGTQRIEVVYEKKTASFPILILDKAAARFILRVYGGVPIREGEGLDESEVNRDLTSSITNESDTVWYFEQEYNVGFRVTLDWVAVAGQEFSSWTRQMRGDAPRFIDDKRMTVVKITSNDIPDGETNRTVVYRAVTRTATGKVRFVTNCDDYTIADKNTNLLNASDVEKIYWENYVFDGWTLTAVEGDNAVDNTTVTKITFPFKVTLAETVLYGTWRTLGLGYAPCATSINPTGGWEVISYLRNDVKELEIPEEREGKPIVKINRDAFRNADRLERLTIPAVMRTIEDGAFRNCTLLSQFTVSPAGAKYANVAPTYSVFEGALFNEGRKNNRVWRELVAYPSARLISEYPFNDVQEVKPYAFFNAVVGRVVLPSSLNEIGEFAFNSVHIDSVDFSSVNPNELADINVNVFSANIRTVYVSEARRGTYYDKSGFYEVRNKFVTNAILQSTVRVNPVGELLYRTIDGKDEIIGAKRTLTTISIPSTLTTNVSSIGYRAFNGCYYLTSFSIPLNSRLERILDNAFDDTPWFKNITVESQKFIYVNNVLYKYWGTNSSFTLDVRTKRIAERAFNGLTTLVTIEIAGGSNDLEFIGAYAFYNCVNFVGTTTGGALQLKNAVAEIAPYAFYNTAIKYVTLPSDLGSQLRTVGEGAFANCRYLTRVDLGARTDNVANDAFKGSYSLCGVDVQTGSTAFVSYDGVLYKYAGGALPTTLFLYPAGRLAAEFDINRPVSGVNLSVDLLESNSFYHSNIAALYLSSGTLTILSEAIVIAGLIYLKIETLPSSFVTYNEIFGAHLEFAPSYVVITDTSSTNLNRARIFFGVSSNPELLSDPRYKTSAADVFNKTANFVETTVDSVIKIVRSSRTEESLDLSSLSARVIAPYAFFGYCLNEVFLSNQISRIEPYAFSYAFSLTRLFTIAGGEIPQVGVIENNVCILNNSFGEKFDNGLFIFTDAAQVNSYISKWLIQTGDRYVIDILEGQPIAKFDYATGQAWEPPSLVIPPKKGTVTWSAQVKPERSGYTFFGWYYDDGAQRVFVYINGAAVSDAMRAEVLSTYGAENPSGEDTYVIPFNVTLFCYWVPKTYAVTFVIENGASMENMTDTVTFNRAYNFEIPVLVNFVFLGWKTQSWVASGGEKFEYAPQGVWTDALLSSGITLYSVFERKEYDIYRRTSDVAVTVPPAPVKVMFGEHYDLGTVEKDGYDFLYWFIIVGTTQRQLTNSLGESIIRWDYSNADEFEVYPCFSAAKTITVRLYLKNAQGEYLNNVVEVAYGSIANLPLLQHDLPFDNAAFCGWYYTSYDGLGNVVETKVTDEYGIGLFPWGIDLPIVDLYAQFPVRVSNAEEFFALEATPLASIILTQSFTIDHPWGNASLAYLGLFNGANFTITLNFTVTEGASFDGYAGVFAKIGKGGSVKNLRVVANIEIVTAVSTLYVGAVAGKNEGVIVGGTNAKDVTANISVTVVSTVTTVNAYIGAIAGHSTGSITKIGVEVSELSFTASGVLGERCVGIAVGYLSGLLDGTSKASVYYYKEDDLYKNKVCGLMSPTATKNNFTMILIQA